MVKAFKKTWKILCVVAILLTLPISVSAIDFDAEELYHSVFVVMSGNSLGSGFAIGENCVATNAHVLDNPDDIVLETYSGETTRAFLLGMDLEKDIALLGVEGASFPCLRVADSAALAAGEDVFAIGAPKSMAYTLTKGVVSAKERLVGGQSYIQTDAAVNEGNSGGPLVNSEGNVIGVNTLKLSDSEGISLAIPITMVSDFAKELGIDCDENGNVAGTVFPVPAETPDDEGNSFANADEGGEEQSSPINRLLLIGLCASLVANIVLVIALLFQKKKNLTLQFDPRERTEFDIDILE